MLGWWSDAREPAVDCAWISAAFAAPPSDAAQRHALLSGRPGAAAPRADRLQLLWVGNGQLTRPSPAAAPASGRWVEAEMRDQLRLLRAGAQRAAGGATNPGVTVARSDASGWAAPTQPVSASELPTGLREQGKR